MPEHLTELEIDTAEHIFRRFLRERGLKFTPERRAMLHEVLNIDQHFEAEQLLISLRKSGKKAAKATIYRTLPLLVDCGIIRQLQFNDKLAHYEHTFGHDPHDHLVCRQCRRIIEFDSGEVARLREEVAAQHNFQATGHRFQITGLCGKCAKRDRRATVHRP